jgi:hypothetical protein
MNRSAKITFLNDNKFWFKEIEFKSFFEIDCEKLFIPYFYYNKYQVISSVLSFALKNYKKHQIAFFDFQKFEIILNFEYLLKFFKERICNSDESFIIIMAPEFFDKYDANLKIYRFLNNGKLKIFPIDNFKSFYESKIKFNLNKFILSLMLLYEIREKISFFNTISYILENISKPFNFRQAVIDLNIRFETLKNFIDYLEKAFLIKVLEEEDSPRAMRTIIFNDWRIYNYLMNYSKRELILNDIHKAATLSYEFLKATLENKTIKIDNNLNPIVSK